MARPLLLATALLTTLAACTAMPDPRQPAARAPLTYPTALRGAHVDDYHGTRVPDPYRWLEDAEAPATREFVRAQNALAQPWLEALPQRAWLRDRLTELWDYERVEPPRVKGGKYFFRRNDGKQNQSVLWVVDSLQATPRVLFDPNASRSDATVALARFEPSPDGSIVAYSLSDGGTDWEASAAPLTASICRTNCATPSSGTCPGRRTGRASTTAATRRARTNPRAAMISGGRWCTSIASAIRRRVIAPCTRSSTIRPAYPRPPSPTMAAGCS